MYFSLSLSIYIYIYRPLMTLISTDKIETEINRLKYPSFRRTRGLPESDNTPRQQNIAKQPDWRRVQSVTNRKKSREDRNTQQHQYTEHNTSKQISTTTRSKQHISTQQTNKDTWQTTTTQRPRSKDGYNDSQALNTISSHWAAPSEATDQIATSRIVAQTIAPIRSVS